MSNEIINDLMRVPYVENSSLATGFDCAGLVEVYYQLKFGIELNSRGDLKVSSTAIQDGVELTKEFYLVDQPQDDDLVLMKKNNLKYGHVGVFYNNRVLHIPNSHGALYQHESHPYLKAKITGYLRYDKHHQ